MGKALVNKTTSEVLSEKFPQLISLNKDSGQISGAMIEYARVKCEEQRTLCSQSSGDVINAPEPAFE